MLELFAMIFPILGALAFAFFSLGWIPYSTVENSTRIPRTKP